MKFRWRSNFLIKYVFLWRAFFPVTKNFLFFIVIIFSTKIRSSNESHGFKEHLTFDENQMIMKIISIKLLLKSKFKQNQTVIII